MKKLFFLVIALMCVTFSRLGIAQNVNVGPVAPATYATLGAAFTAINAGTHGAGAIAVTIVANTTEAATATLNGGVFASCTIMPTTTVFVGGSVATNPLIDLNGADNVIIDGRVGGTGSTNALTVQNIGTGGCIRLQNGAQNNTVRYVNANGISTAGIIINIAQSTAGTGGNNNNIIEFCNTKRGVRGIQNFGTAGLFTNDNNIIRNNKVRNFNAIGIFVGSVLVNTDVLNNECYFDSSAAAGATNVSIQVQGGGTTNIKNNRIYGLENAVGLTTSYRGMITLPASNSPLPDPAATVNIMNNSVAMFPNNTSGVLVLGIQTQFSAAVTSVGYTANVYNNTSIIGGTTATATTGLTEAIFGNVVTPIGAQTYIQNSYNNIAINRRFGGSASTFHIAQSIDSSSNLTTNCDHNLASASDSIRGWAAEYGSFVYRNTAIDLYKMATCQVNMEQHTAFKEINTVTTTSNLALGLVGGDLCGMPTALVPTDINGVARNANYPYKGAYEGSALKVLTLGAKLEGVSTTEGITVKLVSAGCGIMSTCTADLISGTGKFCYGDSIANGTGYYLFIKSRNAIQTSSAATQTFAGGLLSYNFKTAATQAFGSNMANEGGTFVIYGGDVTQDGIVDGGDGALIDNDAANFVGGCNITTDINNDGIVDGTDASITDNNASNFVSALLPCPGPESISTGYSVDAKTIMMLKKDVEVEQAGF